MTDETPAGSLDATPDQVPEEAPKPRRRRRTRAEIEADKLAKAAAAEAAAADGQPGADEAPKPRRRRASRKKAEDASATQAELPIGPAPAVQESATSAPDPLIPLLSSLPPSLAAVVAPVRRSRQTSARRPSPPKGRRRHLRVPSQRPWRMPGTRSAPTGKSMTGQASPR